MSAGKLQRNPSTGKFKRNPTTGKLRRNTATNTTCCCAAPPVYCGSCPNPSPASMRVVFSGISVDTCFLFGSFYSISFNPNGTWDFTLDPTNPCKWLLGGSTSGLDTGSATVTKWTDATCSVAIATQTFVFGTLTDNAFSATDGQWEIGLGTPATAAIPAFNIFLRVPGDIVGVPCYSNFTLTNLFTSFGSTTRGKDGTAAVSVTP